MTKKLNIKNEDFFMVLELYKSVVSCFEKKIWLSFSFVFISGY